ncbi:MAG: HdeD family acid-resistance protein [Planctomycetota bacterium]
MGLPFPPSLATSPRDDRTFLRKHWWVYFVFGMVSVFVGILAIGSPHVATLKTVVVIGALMLAVGITEIIHAVTVRNLKGFAMHLLSAGLYLIVGVFLLEGPEQAMAVLTLLFAASFFVGGALRIIFSFVERFPAWPWVLLHGVVDLFLGVLIWRGWPESSLWVIGLFIGIDLLLHGWCWIILALSARTYNVSQPA